MDGSQQTLREIRAGGEKTENINQRKLDDATFEPKSYLEQTGDYKQSEAIQNAVVGMVDNAVAQADTVADVSTRSSGQADADKTEQTGIAKNDAKSIHNGADWRPFDFDFSSGLGARSDGTACGRNQFYA